MFTLKTLALASLLIISGFASGYALADDHVELKGLSVGMTLLQAAAIFPGLEPDQKYPGTYKDQTATIVNHPAVLTIALKDGKVDTFGFQVNFNQQYEADNVIQALMAKFPGLVCNSDQSNCQVIVGKDKIYTMRIGGGNILPSGALFVNVSSTSKSDL
jgi:hypothetical protein